MTHRSAAFLSGFFLLPLALALAACSGGVKETLGLNRKSPDEFAVVKRAPLSLPPNYELRPPRPGAPRPQEQAPNMQAQQAVFGAGNVPGAAPTGSEDILLQQAGATSASPEIRALIDREAGNEDNSNKPIAERLLGVSIGGNDNGDVVDPKKEMERLRQAEKESEPPPQEEPDGEKPEK